MSWIPSFLVWTVLALHQAASSGVFELRLISFDNESGRDDLGKCCSGLTGPNSKCEGSCQPRFRICLKEYQVKIDTTSPCTFGDVIIPEFETTTSTATDSPKNGYRNSIAVVPFKHTWTGTFSLIVEAWHEDQTSSAVLVSRLTRQRWLDVSDRWTEDEHTSKYFTLKFEYRVTCESHYYGKGCENTCRSRDDDFGHWSCSPTGERVCLAGWTGDYCTTPQCPPGCQGKCEKPNFCRCNSTGWEGTLCDQCVPYPGCMHGTCIKPWDCICNEGWGGLFCNQDLNFCTNHKPCRNGGTCFNTGQGSYTCSCPTGYTGKNCETPLHDCTKTPCLNGGTCSRNGTLNVCLCPVGHNGPRCEHSARTCEDRPCQNGGSCSLTSTSDGGYKCECRPGYGGFDCERQNSHCNPSPCKNDGNCVEGTAGYQCICPSGFAGERCETNIDDCLGNPCQNGGTCLDKVNEFRCQCVPGFVGPLCQNRVDYCITKPCANGGTCLQLINDYKCQCARGFAGKDCSEEVNECQYDPCQHGGTCVNTVHGYECHCPPGYLGRECDEVSSSAAPSARVSSGQSSLSTEHVVVIATISTFVPLVVLIAVGVIICLKQRRKRDKARADEEARLQNEQNTANSSYVKRGAAMSAEAHMIKNSWGKTTNNSNISPDDCSVSNISVGDCDGFPKPMHQVIDGRPVYSLQRTRSHKQLNTEPGPRASALLAAKLQEPEYEHIKRLSVMSNASAVCGSSDPSLLKRPAEKESNGVYVIEEHFHRPDAISAGLFATEV